MKNILLFIFSICLLNAGSAMALTSAPILMERTVNVGFAPPANQGVFKLQILTDGTVRTVDNKNKVEAFAKLAKKQMQNLAAAVEKAQSTDLKFNEGPACMDAPSQSINIYQASGKKIIVLRKEACKEAVTSDESGSNLVLVMKGLDSAYQSLKYLNIDTEN